MPRSGRAWLITFASIVSLASCATVPPAHRMRTSTESGFGPGIHILSRDLDEAFRGLDSTSPTWRAEIGGLATDSLYTLVIGYTNDLMAHFPSLGNPGDQIAHIRPLPGASSLRQGAIVAIGTEALAETAQQRGYPHDRLIRDLRLILAHEVYGHLIPVWSGLVEQCSDLPIEGDHGPACAIQRENAIRDEIGVSPRENHMSVDIGFICYILPQRCDANH